VLPGILLSTYSGTITASLADIKVNNIPRYVHIFDAEESIDLNAIAAFFWSWVLSCRLTFNEDFFMLSIDC